MWTIAKFVRKITLICFVNFRILIPSYSISCIFRDHFTWFFRVASIIYYLFWCCCCCVLLSIFPLLCVLWHTGAYLLTHSHSTFFLPNIPNAASFVAHIRCFWKHAQTHTYTKCLHAFTIFVSLKMSNSFFCVAIYVCVERIVYSHIQMEISHSYWPTEKTLGKWLVYWTSSESITRCFVPVLTVGILRCIVSSFAFQTIFGCW